ncbi:MAG TPA: CoA transferase, partial [Rhodospirillales bacterium]|nr:CoA transferase [Rhodospirillales bacterium]
MTAPLEGWRVVDLTTVLFGPYATRILADYGAEVIKVEPPSGDLTRWLEPFRSPGMGAMFIAANRGKRSLVLDLKKKEARAILRELVAGADILVHSIRPKAAARLGITFEAMRALKPDLIYCELTGYGQGGPWRDLPAYDDTVQAASGIVALEGEVSDEPHYVPTTLADKVGSLHVVHAIL